MKHLIAASALAAAALLGPAPATAQIATLYSCPDNGTGGDQVTRGFYVTNYPGATLETVTLRYYSGSGDGDYTVSLTARLSTYDGTIIGSTQTRTINFAGQPVSATFVFGGAPVPPGSTVTFTQVLISGPAPADNVLFYDTGVEPCANVTQTNGTNAPLSSFRRNSVGVTITGSRPVAAPVPTLGGFALVALASLLALVGFRRLRGR